MVVSAAIRGSALGKIAGKKGDIRVCSDLMMKLLVLVLGLLSSTLSTRLLWTTK